MAHADYDCCAVCDCKMSFSYNSETKEDICEDCLITLRDNNLSISTVKELIGWIKKKDSEKLKEKVGKIGFSKCCYDNDVDEALEKVLTPTP